MEFAKMVNGELVFAPKFLKKDNAIILTNSQEEYANRGYKPMQYTEPLEQREGYTLSYHWEDAEDCILQVWTETENVGLDSEVINILMGEVD